MASIEWQNYLADILRDAGLVVIEEPGWKARTQSTRNPYKPVGLLNHHTAPPNPYPVDRLYQKCNLFIARNGNVHVVSGGYQWDSGNGSPAVLAEVIDGSFPGGRAKDRGIPLEPDVSGNPYFIDIEVDHPGDGSPLPDVQFEALIRTDAAILLHKGWGVQQLLGHSEWTPRKIDPRWDGSWRPMPSIRAAVQDMMEEMMARFDDVPVTHTFYEDIEWLAEEGFTRPSDNPSTPDVDESRLFRPDEPVTRGQLAAFLRRATS